MANIPSVMIPTPGTTGQSSLSTLYLDGVPLEDLQALYDLNTRALGGQRWDSPNRFWATPPRPATSPLRDVIEVSLSTPKWVNRFSYQVSNFPCRVWLQYWDLKEKRWRPVRHRRNGRPARTTIRNSVPEQIHADVVKDAHRHPHHRGAGHWRTVNIRARGVKSNRFRLVLSHLPSKNAPKQVRTGRFVDYSLAVQDLQVGFEVTSPEDAPRTTVPTQDAATATAFASSTDLLGSPVEFALREYRASDILWPVRNAIAGVPRADRIGEAHIWKSEPQPVSYAVVNLYVDARDTNGQAQSVDRFFVDPTTSGVSANLYYSNDDLDPALGFAASDEALRFPGVRQHGTVRPIATGLNFPDSGVGYLDIDNTLVQWDKQRAWWVGAMVQPQFDSTDAGEWTLLDSEVLSIHWRNQRLEVRVFDSVLVHDTLTFGVNDRLPLVIAWNGDPENPRVRVRFADGFQASAIPSFTPRDLDDSLRRTIRLGGSLDAETPGLGNFRLMSLVLKQEALPDDGAAYFDTTVGDYLLRPDLDEDREDHTRNALLRYHPSFQTPGEGSINPFGLVGGPGVSYDTLTWTPINRDFKLHKGYMKFDPVKARYFKFEFTNLAAQPHTSIAPVTRKVKVFTTATVESSMGLRSIPGGPTTALGGSGAAVNQELGDHYRFTDERRLITRVNPDRSYSEYTPTEALFSRDLLAQQRLAKLNPAFHLQPWHQSHGAPRFTRTQRHYYETVEVAHSSKVAYFVGLNALRMFTVDYAAADDTEAYLFTFHDRNGLDDESSALPWASTEPYGLRSPATLPAGFVESTSQVLRSRRNVRGIQFATMQTPATQLLSDADFNDEALSQWRPYNGATIEPSDDLNSDIGTTIKVTRQAAGAYWSYMERQWDSWDAIEESDPDTRRPSWNEVTAGDTTSGVSTGGVESVELIQPATQGRLYAAARVYAPTSLNGPLHLQIVSEGGEVLADERAYPAAGQITEWYVGYTIGDSISTPGGGSADILLRTWAMVEVVAAEDPGPPALSAGTQRTWDDAEALGDWDHVEKAFLGGGDEGGSAPEAYTGKVFARLFQEGPTEDEFYVDNISVFEDPIVWEFSNDDGQTWWKVYDIRNNPHGVFLFPTVPSETIEENEGTNLRWRVRGFRPDLHVSALLIRPWYSSLHLGVMPRETIEHGGPNLNPYDQYPSVVDSPPFKVWSKPIPEDWWFLHRQWLLLQHEVETRRTVVLPEALAAIRETPPPTLGLYPSDSLYFDTTPSIGAYVVEGIVI